MGVQVGEISGQPFTDRAKRIGAVKDTAIRVPVQRVRQVDGGMWQGPSLRNDTERAFVRWLKREKSRNQDERVLALRKDFIKAVENAYLISKGVR